VLPKSVSLLLLKKTKNKTVALSPPRGALCVLPKSVSLLLLTIYIKKNKTVSLLLLTIYIKKKTVSLLLLTI